MPTSPLMQKRRSAICTGRSDAGFTLIELMVSVAVAAILASIALPSYADYVRRAKVPAALVELTMFYTRMEQRFQDSQSYGTSTACGLSPSSSTTGFIVTCSTTGDGAGFVATATGQGALNGYAYSIDQNGGHHTVSHPKGAPSAQCWSIKGLVCDS